MKVCPNCNSYVDDNAVFCSTCGVQFVAQNDYSQQQVYDPNMYAQQQAYDPNMYAQQEMPQQQVYDPNVYAQQEGAQPKKTKKGLLIGIIAAALVVLAAIGFVAQNLFQSWGYGNGGIIGLGSSLKGEDVFDGERFDEMLWGYYEFENYQYSGSFECTEEFRQDMQYVTVTTEYGDQTFSALPINMYFGSYAHFMGSFIYDGEYYEAYTEKGRAMFRKAYMEEFGDLSEEDFQKIEKIMNLSVVEMCFVFENGASYLEQYAYEIQGNKLLGYDVIIDDQYNIIKSDKPAFEYEFLHDGGKLMMAYKGLQCNYRTYGYDATDRNPSISGYAWNSENQYKNLEGFSVYNYDKNEEHDVFVYLANGEKPIDPTFTLDRETGNFTLSWAQCWAQENGLRVKKDAPATISGTIIPFSNYGGKPYSGFVLIIDGTLYRYFMSSQEYDERLADLSASTNLSGDQQSEIANKKRNLLEELEKAFKDAGIAVTVDYDRGKIALEASFLFDTDSYELSADGQKYLDSFMSVYTSVVLKEEYSAYISKIVVEGHTDTRGSYSHNQKLSQDRADTVAQRCIDGNPQIANVMQAVGCSYDYPVYNADGSVNMDASRRVTFSFVFAG